MSTTLNLTYKRFVRRADSGLVTNTQFLAAMDVVGAALTTAPWVETDLLDAVHPVNSPSLGGFSGQAYDAYRQSGDAASGTGRQCVYGGMALYRFSVPAAASGTFINSISLKVSGDKFLVGGLTIAAILSDSATPPTDWNLLRNGGVNATVDTSSQFAASAVVAETATLVSQSQNRTDAITLDLSAETSYHPWIWVAVSLTTFASSRREYWVEGSGALVGAECAVTFAGEVTPAARKIELRNEYSLEDIYTNRHGFCSSIDNETAFALTYFQDTAIRPTSEPGDAVMMRRVLESREHQHIAQQRSFGGTYSAGHGIVVELATWGGYIGCRYQNLTDAPKWHRYELRGLFFVRSAFTSLQTVAGLSFDSAIPAIPAGETVRIAMYAHDGPLPPSSMLDGDRIGLNMISMHSASDYDVVSGVATTIKLAVGLHVSVNSDDSLISNPMYDAPVVPLGHYDIVGGTGLAANTMIPFAAPYTLPRYVAIFVAINVIKYDDNWVAAPDQHTSVRFNPSDFFLHVV